MNADPGPAVTWAQARSWRLGRQLLEPRGTEPVDAVIRRVAAVPATDPSTAELMVAARTQRPHPGDLGQALADGRIIKSFVFRGGTYYLSPEDGGAYLALRAASRMWELPSWQDYYQLGPTDWPAFREAVRAALADGPLTISELGVAVTARPAFRHLRPVFDDGAGTLLKPLSWQGDMSFGLPRDGQTTFQRLDTNPRWSGIWDLEEAGRHAVTEYVSSYGPATTEQVQYWLGDGLSAGSRRIRGWLADLADALAAVRVDGRSCYVLRGDVDALVATRPSSVVRLLPGYDPWVMGPGTKEEQIVPAALRTPVTRKANLVLAGGVVGGTWTVSKDRVTVAWLEGVGGRTPRRALEEEVERLGEFYGRSFELVLTFHTQNS